MRVIFIKSSRVISARNMQVVDVLDTILAEDELLLVDPWEVYNAGDVFVQEYFEQRYSGLLASQFAPPAPELCVFSVSLASTPKSFLSAGLQFNVNPLIKSKYSYFVKDTSEIFKSIQTYGRHHNVTVPNFSLCDKQSAQYRFTAAGFSTIPTVGVATRQDLVELPYEMLIIKPTVSYGGLTLGYPFAELLYCIKTKEELLAALDGLAVFSDPQTLRDYPIVAQKAVLPDGEDYQALILSGGVNGAGDFWHFSPILLNQQFNDGNRNAKTVWATENNTEETLRLQSKVEALVNTAGSRNCFYQLQFLLDDGVWRPHDFQYRMSYYMDSGLEQLGYGRHKADALKFVFDKSNKKPAQPAAFGLNLVSPRTGQMKTTFVSADSRAAVLAKLGLL
jgi:hypothetical protein